MALDSARLSNSIRDKLVAAFMWPVFDDTELRKFTTAVAEAVKEEFDANAELENAALDVLTVTINGTDSLSGAITATGTVDNMGKVSGGLK